MSFFFVQMADPQFGQFAQYSGLSDSEIERYKEKDMTIKKARKITGFADETRLYEEAIEVVNRLRPDLVLVCGDLVHDSSDELQIREIKRITAKLHPGIPIHWVSGNHDVGSIPTKNSLERYRNRFGQDNYSFSHKGCSFIIVNSSVCFDPSSVPDEWDSLITFLKRALQKAADDNSMHIMLFMHHPLFLTDPEAVEDTPFVMIPKERRDIIMDLLSSYGVSAVFAGHWHRNVYGSFGENIEMITSGPVGYPLGDDPSGFRIVQVLEERIEHQYYGFEDMPENIED